MGVSASGDDAEGPEIFTDVHLVPNLCFVTPALHTLEATDLGILFCNCPLKRGCVRDESLSARTPTSDMGHVHKLVLCCVRH